MERQTLMIVDDSSLNRKMLIEILGDRYNYIEAENGRQAVKQLINDMTVDLILLDINMPEMNGFQVLEHMNKLHWINEIPVVVISADEANESLHQAYSLGITDYIRRPFDVFIVRRRVENTLKIHNEQKRLMNLVADQIYEREENNDLMVGILSHVVEFRNSESRMHIHNICIITELLLRQLVQKTDVYHLSEADIALIKTASAVHDIGKICIPEEILNKPGKLTKEEFALIKTHTTAGAKILERTIYGHDKPLFKYTLEICRWHHERWDGHGYPDGLRGEKIPISAQVVAIADVYDALTSERCYKKAFDHDTSISMIINGECGAFNPLLLECMLDIAPQLRTLSDASGSEHLGRLEIKRLANEILSNADGPRNDRMQRMIGYMQERIRFFSECSGGIQFDYDAITKIADVVNWDEPPKYRYSVKDAAKPECFERLKPEVFERIKEAMAATTREIPDFSMSILLDCGNEHHWCELKVRTLWSEFDKDHYIAAVGQLIDPQLSDKKYLQMPEPYSGSSDNISVIAEEMHRLEAVFDVVRLVDPNSFSVLELDKDGVLRRSGKRCAAFWNNGNGCANCISARAFAQKATLNKLEFTNTDAYFVVSKYICVNGTPCVLEMLSKMNEGRWIDSNGTRLIIDSSQGENVELFMDAVTGTYSRRYFEAYRAHLEGMECIAVIDVDGFKQVNDTFGHLAGDNVLRDIAAAIHATIRSTDILIRYGGDEFVLLFPKMDEKIFEKKRNDIKEAVNKIVLSEYPGLKLSVSIGGVCGVHPITEAIRQADILMYEDKEKTYAEASTPPEL